jgi:hypothetical protein
MAIAAQASTGNPGLRVGQSCVAGAPSRMNAAQAAMMDRERASAVVIGADLGGEMRMAVGAEDERHAGSVRRATRCRERPGKIVEEGGRAASCVAGRRTPDRRAEDEVAE